MAAIASFLELLSCEETDTGCRVFEGADDRGESERRPQRLSCHPLFTLVSPSE